MSLDREELARAVAREGRVARVVLTSVDGSTPRGPGTAMLVWPGGQSGTIGGGGLEFQAAKAARALLADGGARRFDRVPLGPSTGQCCGGSVRLLTEVFDPAAVAALPAEVFARPVADTGEMPLAVTRLLSAARSSGARPTPQLVQGWFVEPLSDDRRPLWIYGSGHVGRALVAVLAPLPDFAITWVDTAAARFPEEMPTGVERLIAANPADLVPHAPAEAEHLILTYSHALDLELCHALLTHGFAWAGLIGSATKWARFRGRLAALGHTDAQIARIRCPIGQPALGKHPQAIAVGVAAELLSAQSRATAAKGATG